MVTSGALQPGASTLDSLHPVGSSLTFPAVAFGSAISGSTAPELGAFGGFFAAFDDATTEALAFVGFGMLCPDTWLTYSTWLEARNFTGSAGDVVWRVTEGGGASTDTTISYPDAAQNIVRVPAATIYTMGDFTVAGVGNKGGAATVARVGGAAADTLAGDVHLAALHIVRVT